MFEARAQATVPASPDEVFAAATDIDNADWLPAVRRVRRLEGPPSGLGARYAVDVGLLGRTLSGVLVCRTFEPPRHCVLALEDGLDLTITIDVEPVSGGSAFELVAAYTVGGGPLAQVAERASSGPARREVARAVEQLSARFGRKANVNPSA
jgi:carbon monoxide dehydrogenase subunit G